jgi:threonine dehydrogenase-like Zn-dependent dehydrogenase
VNARQATASAKLQEIMSGKGADVVIECAGTRTALELALQVIGRRGRIAIEGVHDANETMSFSPYFLLAQAASLAGISGWVTADFVQALELLHRGLVKVEPLITHTFSLGEWETAFDLITTRKSEAIKVQLAP